METPKENVKSLNKDIVRFMHQKYGKLRYSNIEKSVTRDVLISLSPRGKPIRFANKQDELTYNRRQKSLLPNVKKALSYIFPSPFTEKTHYEDDSDELLGILTHKDRVFNRKTHKFPSLGNKRTHSSDTSPTDRQTSAERIQFYNYTGEAESVYLGTRAGISESKQLYDRCLQQAGLYSFLNDTKHRKKIFSKYK